MPQFDPIFDDAAGELKKKWSGQGEAPAPTAPRFDPIFQDADKELSAKREERIRGMEKFLKQTEPAGRDLVSEAPMLGADVAGGVLAAKGLTALGRAVGLPAAARFLTGTASGLAKWPSLIASGGLQGALASGINRLFGEETPTGPAAAVGAVVNPLTHGVGSALFGSSISPETAQLAQKYVASGVPLQAYQVPGASKAAAVAGRVGTLPVALLRKLTGASSSDVQNLTASVMKTLGSPSRTLTADSLEAAQDAIGARLESIAQGAGNLKDARLHFDTLAAWQRAQANLLDPAAIDKFNRVTDPIFAAQDISGNGYQELTQKGSRLWQALRDPALAPYASDLRSALDDALERAAPGSLPELRLARNQYRNSKIIENNPRMWNETTGMVDPNAFASAIMKKSGYQGTGKATLASDAAGQPVNIGTLAEGAQTFAPQGPSVGKLAAGATAGAGLLGFGELEGLPLIEYLGGHPALTLGLGGTLAGVGALQNTRAYTNWLLARAAAGKGPLAGGANLLIPGAVAAQQGGDGSGSGSSIPVTSRMGALSDPSSNWSNWLRGQSFLESPTGAPSRESSAKGYFQFIDGTARKALAAGLPNPQVGSYQQQADATRAYIEHFYPRAAQAISQGDFPSAVPLLRSEWPSLPGGSQAQSADQYSQWNRILGA